MPTDYKFTGQRREAGLGLYFYRARWYDPSIGRFIRPVTIVPDPMDPQSLNRYAYVLNNPLRYIDPAATRRHVERVPRVGVVMMTPGIG